MKRFDAEEVRRWHKAFKREGELFEIRLLGYKTYSGYFTDVEKAVQAIAPFDEQEVFQVYFTVNEVNHACSSRKQYNQFLMVNGSATSKNDIVHRWWLPIDVDVKRPTDISSTDEEKEYAHKKAGDVYLFLQEKGFPVPIVCDSSSGYHLYYPVDLDNTPEVETLVHSLFDILSARFTDDRVKIDKAVTDANRIMRLAGTWGRKGRDSEERPHRMAKILATPPRPINRATMNFLNSFVEKYRIVEDKPMYKMGTPRDSFDLRSFIREHGLSVRNETSWGNGGVKFVLEECPFDSSHKAPDSALFLSAQGAIGFKCFHDSCSHHDWHELRQMLDPIAYNHSSWQPQYRTYKPQVPPPIKEESKEIGKKWLSLTDIEDENIDDLPRIHTGFSELDYLMGGGLFFSETSIVSGINGSGKSSWLNTLILNTIQDGHKAALWTGELPAKRLKRWIVQAAAGDAHVAESRLSRGKFYVPKMCVERISKWTSGNFFLFNNEYPPNYAQLLSDMAEPLAQGVRLFVLDNLFAMDLDGLDGDENARQKALILSLARFAKKHAVHVILVAHPRKVVTFLRKEDILGSSALQNAVDNIFIIHRCGEDFRNRIGEYFAPSYANRFGNYGNVLEICKNREFGAIEQMIGLNYSTKSRRFFGDNGCLRYGWEEEATQATVQFERDNNTMPFAPTDGEAPF